MRLLAILFTLRLTVTVAESTTLALHEESNGGLRLVSAYVDGVIAGSWLTDDQALVSVDDGHASLVGHQVQSIAMRDLE
jgi:hypothetical protein